MTLGSWIVLAVLALCVALAIRSLVKQRKAGQKPGCGSCTGCSGGPIPATCTAAELMVQNMNEAADK